MAAAAGAGKRIAKSSVQWGKFAQKVPKDELPSFQVFKARSDHYVARVQSLPEELPSLDWGAYKKRAPAMASAIDQLQKHYQALQIPYPKADAQLSAIDAQHKEEVKNLKQWVEESKARVVEAQESLAKIESIPPLDHLTPQEYMEYFPGSIRDQKTDPFFIMEHEKENDEDIKKYQSDFDFKLSSVEEGTDSH